MATVMLLLGAQACREGPGDPPGGETGVPECDEYLQRLDRCVAAMPEPARTSMQSVSRSNHAAWRSASRRTDAAASCRAAIAGLASSPSCH
jgi:hypothetical protein